MARHDKPDTPKAVVEEIKKDLAASERGKKGIIPAIASKWGVTECVVTEIGKRERRDIMMLREGIAERGLVLAAMVDERTLEALQDDDRMKETPLRDFARAREGLVNSALVALEGHQAQVQNFNFAMVKDLDAKIEANDLRLRQKKEELAKVSKVIDIA